MALHHTQRIIADSNARTTLKRLAKSIFSSDVALVGINDQGVIAAHWLLYKRDPVSQKSHDAYLRYEDRSQGGHLRSGHRGSAKRMFRYFLEFDPVDDYQKMLNDSTHTITSWYLVGLDFEVSAELDPIGVTQGGTGTFGLGEPESVLDEVAFAAEGRFWLRWNCGNVSVGSDTPISFQFADENGVSDIVYRTTVQYHDGDNLYARSLDEDTRSFLSPRSTFIIDLDWFYKGRPDARVMTDLVNTLSQRFQSVANFTGETLYNASAIVESPLATLPTPSATLLDLLDSGNWWDSFTIQDDTSTYDPLHFNQAVFQGAPPSAKSCYAASSRTFSWPSVAGKGVKITVGMHAMHSSVLTSAPVDFNLRVVPTDKNWRDARPIFEYHDDGAVAARNCIGTDTGSNNLLQRFDQLERNLPDTVTAFQIPSHLRQTYEFYYMPDGRVFVYLDGRYMNVAQASLIELRAGREFRFDLASYYTIFDMKALKVEEFDVPNDYIEKRVPMFTAVNSYRSAYKYHDMGTRLNEGQTAGHEAVQLYYLNEYLEFTLTHPAKVSLSGDTSYVGNSSVMTKVDGESELVVPLDPMSTKDFTVIHENLPRGRYRIQNTVQGYFRITGWKAEAPTV